jgi:hypothetical protein
MKMIQVTILGCQCTGTAGSNLIQSKGISPCEDRDFVMNWSHIQEVLPLLWTRVRKLLYQEFLITVIHKSLGIREILPGGSMGKSM